jgi:hypothetical protein
MKGNDVNHQLLKIYPSCFSVNGKLRASTFDNLNLNGLFSNEMRKRGKV